MISSCWTNQKKKETASLKQCTWYVLNQETSRLKKEAQKLDMEKMLVYAEEDLQLVLAPWEWSVSECTG